MKIATAIVLLIVSAVAALIYFTLPEDASKEAEKKRANDIYMQGIAVQFWNTCAPRYGERVVIEFNDYGMVCDSYERKKDGVKLIERRIVATHRQIASWDAAEAYKTVPGVVGKPQGGEKMGKSKDASGKQKANGKDREPAK